MKKYKKTLGAILTDHEKKYYIINKNRVFNVNESAARIFELCNNKTLEEISSKIHSKFSDVDYSLVKTDTLECINELKNMGLVKASE